MKIGTDIQTISFAGGWHDLSGKEINKRATYVMSIKRSVIAKVNEFVVNYLRYISYD